MIKVSDCEELVLSRIWNNEENGGEPYDLRCTMDTINERFKKGWKPQTVSTFLARLIKKGFLSSFRKGRYSYYNSEISKKEYIEYSLKEMADRFCEGDIEKLAEYFDGIREKK